MSDAAPRILELQALVACGYTVKTLAEHSMVHRAAIDRLLRSQTTILDEATARHIDTTYRALAHIPPSTTCPTEKRSVALSIARAAKNGWRTPDEIEDDLRRLRRREKHDIASRPVRDCSHTRVHHEHGTAAAYTQDRCRCEPCSRAKSRATKSARAHGSRLVDAAPVAEHLRSILSSTSAPAVAEVVGISAYQINSIASGKTTRVMSTSADAIMTLRPHDVAATTVRALAARLRLRALARNGWDLRALSRETGLTIQTVSDITHAKRPVITARTDEAVTATYDRLWNTERSGITRNDRIVRTTTKNRAAERRWSVPMGIEMHLQYLEAHRV